MCSSGTCKECTRDPNNYTECAKIVSERTGTGVYDLYCYTKQDIQDRTGPSKKLQINTGWPEAATNKLCETSIPTDEIKDYIMSDDCRVVRVRQPYDHSWYRNCPQKKYQCSNDKFLMKYGDRYMNVFNQVVVRISNEAQELFKRFSVCLKSGIAKVYDDRNGTCNEIESLAHNSYLNCLLDAGFCDSIANYRAYPALWINFIDGHDHTDPYIRLLLLRMLTEAKNCGEDTYKILARAWKGKIYNEVSLRFLENNEKTNKN